MPKLAQEAAKAAGIQTVDLQPVPDRSTAGGYSFHSMGFVRLPSAKRCDHKAAITLASIVG